MEINQSPLAVCFVSNTGYLQHLYVAILSFLKHNQGTHEIFLFNEDIAETEIITLRNFVHKHSPESQLTDKKLDTSRLNHFTGYWEKLGKQVFHRLLIPEELPEKFIYALYMDADIVVNDQLLFDGLPMQDFPVAAVKDNISHILAPKRDLEKYFNAGIMLLNLDLWKAQNAVEKLLTHTPKITRFAEQELLNEVFDGAWLELPKKYNFAANHLRSDNKMPDGKSPAIIHYAGPIKPWIYWVKGSALYWRYISQTPFAAEKKNKLNTVINTLKHLFQSRVTKK